MSPPDALMTALTDLLDLHAPKQDSVNCVELVGSIVEFVASLWEAKHAAAMSCLRKNSTFWTVLVNTIVVEKVSTVPALVLHHALNLLAQEHFVSKKEHDGKLADGLDKSLPNLFKHSTFKELCSRTIGSCTQDQLEELDLKLLRDWRDFTGMLIAAYDSSLDEKNLIELSSFVLKSLISCLANPEEPSLRQSAHLLADTLLSLNSFAGKTVIKDPNYWTRTGQALEALRAAVLQTPAPTHLRLLTAVLQAVSHETQLVSHLDSGKNEIQDHLLPIVSSVLSITEQHCSLASPSDEENFCTNRRVLQVSCSLLHICLSKLPEPVTMLQKSNIVPALLHAAIILVQDSAVCTSTVPSLLGTSEEVICSILRLIAVLAKSEQEFSQLNTENLASSLTLALSSTQDQHVNASVLSQVIWVAVNSLSRQGVAGIDGCVSIAAVHLTSLVDALSRPHQLPDLAYAAAALTASLARNYRLWAASHSHTFSVLVDATAACIHLTTHLIRLRSSLEREVAGKTPAKTSNDSETPDKLQKTESSPKVVDLVNKLFKVLLACLNAIRLLSPDIVEVLCTPSLDVREWLPPLLQPSFRRATSAEFTQPNLGTLVSLLDICNTDLFKDKSKTCKDGLSTKLLREVSEEALGLLVTQAALALLNPDCSSRDARDIRTWLSDDMGTFFGQWLGIRRFSSLASPLPLSSPLPQTGGSKSSSSLTSPQRLFDVKYLRLMQHLISMLCQQHH